MTRGAYVTPLTNQNVTQPRSPLDNI